jgi:hypothetical protein
VSAKVPTSYKTAQHGFGWRRRWDLLLAARPGKAKEMQGLDEDLSSLGLDGEHADMARGPKPVYKSGLFETLLSGSYQSGDGARGLLSSLCVGVGLLGDERCAERCWGDQQQV